MMFVLVLVSVFYVDCTVVLYEAGPEYYNIYVGSGGLC